MEQFAVVPDAPRWDQLDRITDLLRNRSAAHDTDIVAVDLGDGRLSVGELNRAADAIAGDLDRLRPDPGLVVLRLPNCLAAAIAVVAVLRSRHALIIAHPDLPRDAYAEAFAHHGPIAELALAPDGTRLEIRPEPFGPPRDIWRPPVARPGLGIALCVLTSGTTGRPQMIAAPHRQICAATRLITDRLFYRLDDVVPVISPLSFDYGLYQLFLAFAGRSTLVLDPRLGAISGLLAAIARTRATVLPLVPTMLRAVTATPFARRIDTSRVRLITTTGDLLTEADAAAATDLFPHAAVLPMYGLSECKRVAVTPVGLVRPPGAVGVPLDATDATVADASGLRLGPGTNGELVVAGPHLTLGYLGDEAATARRFTVDRGSGIRLLRTGDRLRSDGDGWLHWVGRSNDLIKTSGYRIDPAEIETAAATSGVVAESGAYGRPDPSRGQVPVLRVRLKDGVLPDAGQAAVTAALRRALPTWAVAQIEISPTELPHTPNGKIDRAAIRAQATPGDAPTGAEPSPDVEAAPATMTIPRSGNLINCHTQALLSAFRMPAWVTPALFELATTVPFGVRAEPHDPNRILIPWLDPDIGLDRAADHLGLPIQTCWFATADEAIDRLDQWLRTTPVVIGPVDLGDLAYHELADTLRGCDHYVVALGRRAGRIMLRDPEGHAQVEIEEARMRRAMAATAVPEGRGGYMLRRITPADSPAPPYDMVVRIAAGALGNIAAAGTAALGSTGGYRAIAVLDLDPSRRRSLSLLLPATAARQRLAARFAAIAAANTPDTVRWQHLAVLWDTQVRTLARAHRALLTDGALSELLYTAADLEKQIVETVTDARRASLV